MVAAPPRFLLPLGSPGPSEALPPRFAVARWEEPPPGVWGFPPLPRSPATWAGAGTAAALGELSRGMGTHTLSHSGPQLIRKFQAPPPRSRGPSSPEWDLILQLIRRLSA